MSNYDAKVSHQKEVKNKRAIKRESFKTNCAFVILDRRSLSIVCSEFVVTMLRVLHRHKLRELHEPEAKAMGGETQPSKVPEAAEGFGRKFRSTPERVWAFPHAPTPRVQFLFFKCLQNLIMAKEGLG